MNVRLVTAAAVVAIALGGGYILGQRAPMPASPPAPMMADATAPAGGLSEADVRRLVRDTLMENPEIIRDVFEALQRKEDEMMASAQADVITDEKDRLFDSSRQVVLGNPKGDVTLVEFFDYNCGYCRQAHADMKRLIEQDANLRVVLKELPVLTPGSVEAAHVGAAVNILAPDRYGEFHDTLIGARGEVGGAQALAVAGDMGLDLARIRELVSSQEVTDTIEESKELAGKLAVTGTPTYVTERDVMVGAVGYDTLRGKLDEVRNCARVGC